MICLDCGAEAMKLPSRWFAKILAAHPLCQECADRGVEAQDYIDRIDISFRCSHVPLHSWAAWHPPAIFRDATVRGYGCPPGDPAARALAVQWRQDFGTRGLYLWGESGVGKSHLAYALARAVRFREIDLRSPESWGTTVPERLHDAVRDGVIKSLGTEVYQLRVADVIALDSMDLLAEMKLDLDYAETIIRECRDCDLLVIDDIGSERSTDWTTEQLYRLLKDRTENQRPVIVTSNVPPDRFGLAGGDTTMAMRFASRIAGACDVVNVKARDYRVGAQSRERAHG